MWGPIYIVAVKGCLKTKPSCRCCDGGGGMDSRGGGSTGCGGVVCGGGMNFGGGDGNFSGCIGVDGVATARGGGFSFPCTLR